MSFKDYLTPSPYVIFGVEPPFPWSSPKIDKMLYLCGQLHQNDNEMVLLRLFSHLNATFVRIYLYGVISLFFQTPPPSQVTYFLNAP